MTNTSNLPPFVSKVVAQKGDLESAASAMEIFIRSLEIWLAEFKSAVQSDISGGGATQFIQLTDVPNSYAGQTLKGVRVNAAQNALEFFTRNFLSLTDVPASYAAQGSKVVAVKSAENGLEFVDVGSLIQNSTFLRGHLTLTEWVPATATPFLAAGGINAVNIEAGTGSFQLPATGAGMLPSRSRARYQSTGSGVANSAIRNGGNRIVMRGGASDEGGFSICIRLGVSQRSGTTRLFAGLSANIAFGNATLTSRVNVLGFGYDEAVDTNWQALHNDGAGNIVKIDLGASFPINSTDLMDCQLWVSPGSSTVNYQVTNVGTGAVASGNYNTDIPAATQTLTPYIWCAEGGTATAIRLEVSYLLLNNYD